RAGLGARGDRSGRTAARAPWPFPSRDAATPRSRRARSFCRCRSGPAASTARRARREGRADPGRGVRRSAPPRARVPRPAWPQRIATGPDPSAAPEGAEAGRGAGEGLQRVEEVADLADQLLVDLGRALEPEATSPPQRDVQRLLAPAPVLTRLGSTPGRHRADGHAQ